LGIFASAAMVRETLISAVDYCLALVKPMLAPSPCEAEAAFVVCQTYCGDFILFITAKKEKYLKIFLFILKFNAKIY
jgi:hypothetical protein